MTESATEFARKAKRTLEELADEAQKQGQDATATFRELLGQKKDDLQKLLEEKASNVKEQAESMKGKVAEKAGGLTDKIKPGGT
ncbi:MAG TPA: hypothetical protein VM734_13585 [Kofleriaceae bacterium]|jgi:hypothetical protein|nr:hypothetical protein [Kofleriaceae bacterium]